MYIHPDMLTRDEVISAVRRQGCRRPPLMFEMWVQSGCCQGREDERRTLMAGIPEDVVSGGYIRPGWDEAPEGYPGYCWGLDRRTSEDEQKGYDSRAMLGSWDDLDEFIATAPDPSDPALFDDCRANRAQYPDRFIVGGDFFCLYEMLWSIRGMEGMLTDLLVERGNVSRLADCLRDYHIKVIRNLAAAGADCLWTSDDLGHQTGLFFSPAVFRDVFKPRYADLIDEAHSHGMQFWLHTCGDVSEAMEDFIEIGLDVIHPIQPHAMDARAAVEHYGGRITFMPGIDVQQLLPWGTPEEVEAGTREYVDLFARPDGGFIVSLSNGIHEDVGYENLAAFLQTAYNYGAEHQAALIAGRRAAARGET